MSYRYITLIAALPSLGKSYQVDIPPLSRYQLEKRLKLLTDEHRRLLEEIESVLHWDHLNSHYDDRELIHSAHAVMEKLTHKHYNTIREIINWRLNLRTLLAAFRYREKGEDLSKISCQWGVGELMRHIENNWSHSYFNLQHRYRWLPELQQKLQAQDTIAVEKILFDATWRYLRSSGANHVFDFTAVVRYVLMWNLVARWSSYDADRGVAHFQELVDFALGDFRQIQFAVED